MSKRQIFNTREQSNDAHAWAYTSFDGGRTFKNVELPGLDFQSGAAAPLSYMDYAGDPSGTGPTSGRRRGGRMSLRPVR